MKKTKTIFLLRHGKSAWEHPELEDIKRELLEVGIINTKNTINYLKDISVKIDCIISSPAKRALDTAKIVQKDMNLPEVIVENSLYPCNPDKIFNIISKQNDNINNILIVGHNPGLTTFAQENMNEDIENIETSGLVSCSYFTSSWIEFSISERKLNFVMFPKKI